MSSYLAEAQPLDGIDNVGGPDKITFEQMARDVLAKQGDSKTVVVDPDATYFGTPLATNSPVFLRRLLSAYERR